MADDLVVRRLDPARGFAKIVVAVAASSAGSSYDGSVIALARAYLERDAQLAAMTAERGKLREYLRTHVKDDLIDHLRHSLLIAEAHSENLDKSLTRTEAKLKAATETLERVNGRAQSSNVAGRYWYLDVLRDIRAMCTEALTPRADGGRG